MDQIILLKDIDSASLFGDPFQQAFRRLLGQLGDAVHARMLSEATVLLRALGAGSTDGPSSPALSAAIAITLIHLTMNAPLFISDELVKLWNALGSGHVAECCKCGYRQPVDDPCPVCGGKAGEPGCFARARAKKALSN